ncbi:MAG: hypothetical protein KPEEDBHJ_03402 [Anaerolineales bacterium]|nr:hypothetical protein [Anaerolineales bacterium]
MRKLISPIALLILLLPAQAPVRAQSADSRYFSETGHNVAGEFLAFYQSNPDAEYIYGYPITEQVPSADGRIVQYFQRARFELHEDQPEGSRVQLTALGREMYAASNPLEVGNSFACRLYAETGFSVCFAFLDFFDEHGGAAQFGFPISGFEYHENKIVQYFERARLEWQPWRLEGVRVVVSDLGRVFFDKLNEDPALLLPVNPLDNAPRIVSEVRVRAFVLKAVTLSTDNQSFFVIAQDQNMQPVAGAECVAVVNWPNGMKDSTALPSDNNGVGVFSLAFNNQPYGSLIYVEISCSFNGHTGKTTTSFRIWY